MDEKALNRFIDKIVEAVDVRLAKKPKTKETQAEVLKMDGDIVWVRIPGGAEETPCRISTVKCKVGDVVQCRINNGSGVVTGNQSRKSTDDEKAIEAQKAAEDALKSAAHANDSIDETQQFFWFLNGSGDEAGAHVTEIPSESFRRNPRGGNLLMRSNSVRIRLGTQILSELSANRMTLASGKAVVKYSEDGSAFGLQDSHRIVVCKGTDEADVRNDATLSSMDIGNWDNTKPMAFFNATHSVINGVKSAGCGMYVFTGSGGINFAILTESNELEVSGDVKAGPISVYGLDTALDQQGDAIANLQDDLASIVNNFERVTYSLTLSTNALAAGGHLEYSITKTKSGYYPLGVVGFHSDKQATTVRSCYIDEVDDGTCKVHMHIRNDSGNSASANITGSVEVLWIKLPA